MAPGDASRPGRDVFRAPKGTRDVLAPESDEWIEIVATFAERAARFGYGLVVTPIFEHYEVYARVGESTDVVSKEMYDFLDKGGRRLALRPEGTAGVVRAYVEHRPASPWKAWYVAPNFRYERPQAGRYRQHWQLGAEAIGSDDPRVDVEMIDLLAGLYRALGIADARLLLNSMGDADTRERYSAVLLDYWRAHADVLGAELERAEQNPLRILDSKHPDWQEMIGRAPQLGEHLSDASAAQFEQVQAGLRDVGIAFEIEPRLVRGFDYYTATVFEFQSDAIGGAQNALGGGGRYDRLSEEMGGPAAPAIGFGTGIERILLARAGSGVDAARLFTGGLDAFVIDAVDTGDATALLHELREFGLRADRSYGSGGTSRSMKKQWGAADKSGARYAVMLAPRELAEGHVVVKDLASGEQIEVRRDDAPAWLRMHTEEKTER
jgi:histidyl-tRNA synthetase